MTIVKGKSTVLYRHFIRQERFYLR